LAIYRLKKSGNINLTLNSVTSIKMKINAGKAIGVKPGMPLVLFF